MYVSPDDFVTDLSLEELRRMTPSQRFAETSRLTDEFFRPAKQAIAEANPGAAPWELKYILIRTYYGEELANEAKASLQDFDRRNNV